MAPEDAEAGVGRRAGHEGATADVSAEGVDLTLIREWLAKSPAERLALADAAARELEALRAHVVPQPAPP